MSSKISALKRAIKAARSVTGPQRHGVDGKAIVCACCGHDRFDVGTVPLLGLPMLVCEACGHVELFAKQPPVL